MPEPTYHIRITKGFSDSGTTYTVGQVTAQRQSRALWMLASGYAQIEDTGPQQHAGDQVGPYTPPADVTAALGKAFAGLAARKVSPARIVCVGSSTTAGYLAPAESRYVNRLAANLQAAYPSGVVDESSVTTVDLGYVSPSARPGVHVYNGGVSGTFASNYLSASTVTRTGVLNPRMVIHMVGSNDYWSLVPVAQYKASVLAGINALKAVITGPCVHVLVQAYQRLDVVTPIAPWADYGTALREIAEADPSNVAFIDLSGAYAQVGIPGADPLDLIGPDNTHQTVQGHALMADLLRRALGVADGLTPRYIVLDRFTRPDNAASMGTAETGQVWANLGGVSTIVGGKASATGAGGNTSVVDAGVPDVDMTAIITHGGGANIPGLVFRCSDVSNRWGAFLAPTSGGRVDLYRMAAGTNTTVLSSAKSDYAWAAGREYVLRVVVKADTITVYVDGLNALTYTMSAADLSTFGAFTKVGIRLNNTDAVTRWDNFAVVEAR